MTPKSPGVIAAYFGVIAIWSTTPLAIKWSGIGADFIFPLLIRMSLGMALCFILLAAFRIRLPINRAAIHAYIAAGSGIGGAMALVYWGAAKVPSGLIAVLFGLVPLFTGIITTLQGKDERLTGKKIAGIVLGLMGLSVIFGAGTHIAPDAMLAFFAILAAVITQSASLVWVKQVSTAIHPLALTTGALCLVVALLLPAWWLAFGHIPHWSTLAAVSTLYLGIFGSVLGFTLYFFVTQQLAASQVALITMITPVTALLIGLWLNHESTHWQVWLGTGLILLGLTLHQRQPIRVLK
ncbi:DMT family transporter [Sulfuriferula nivalis]|uniref:Membrane protein n=1 Tax=Sulfuriferula nivalis TaxID=2675298 RepID=A0A809S7T0_9PROT|nr:DMT family transporter [Sulfuriferula nivalis]BBO99751.1 membrane protein [Sulfuriferula nivalis]